MNYCSKIFCMTHVSTSQFSCIEGGETEVDFVAQGMWNMATEVILNQRKAHVSKPPSDKEIFDRTEKYTL